MSALAVASDPVRGLACERAVGVSFDDLACSLGDPLLLLDDEGRILHANPATERVFGLDPGSLVGRPATVLLPPSLRDRHVLGLLRRLRRASEGTCRFEAIGQHSDGRELDLEACLSRVTVGQGTVHACLIRDITEAKAVERRLRASEERLSLALRGAHDAHWDWDLVTGQTHLSPRWRDMLDLDPEASCEDLDAWFSRVIPEDRGRLEADFAAHLEGRTRHFRSEHRVTHADGCIRWMLARGLAVTDPSGRPVRIAGSLTDITDRVKLQERLRREATHDPLTGLPNRAHFFQRLRQSIARARGDDGRPAVAYIDLDGFKQVNDALGHHAGDELLVAVASRLRARIGADDVAARLGGDEFIVLVEGGVDAAARLARDLQADLREPLRLSTGDVTRASASIGIAELADEHRRPEDLVRDADAALYCAKTEGKARHVLFEPCQRDRAPSRRHDDRSRRRSRAAQEDRPGESPRCAGTTVASDGHDAGSAPPLERRRALED